MTNPDLREAAHLFYLNRQILIQKYPGFWTLTLELELIPERMDFAFEPYHAYGFDTRTCNVEERIYQGLSIIQKSLGSFIFEKRLKALGIVLKCPKKNKPIWGRVLGN